MTFTMTPIGVVHNDRSDAADSDHWGTVVSTIEVDERFGAGCLAGLADFSHVEVLYVFDRTAERDDYRQLRAPRGRADLPEVGVFADRGSRRPNRIGATVCAIVSAAGRQLRVHGLDAVDGTPVLDLKPVLREFLPTGVHQPEWAGRLMRDYFRDQPGGPAAGYEVRPVGHVESPLTDQKAAPKQGVEGSPQAWLVFDPAVREAVRDLVAGTDVIVLTWLDRARRDVLAVHPRDDPRNPEQGVFSTRSQDRPNPVGLHRVRIAAVDGLRLRVHDLEALDGTPILDVKPVLDRTAER